MIEMIKTNHRTIVESLESRLRQYDDKRLVMTNREYDVYGVHGEVDVAMISPRRSYLIEVKTNDSEKAFNKVIHQLSKDKRWLMKNYYTENVHCFYAHSTPKGYRVRELDII